ncbi:MULTISPECIES: type I-E CRISPR-associated endonuclease Cas1e [Microvirgula]|uniref:CRISPR-associated endonuclease Cas1 n=1 Tax=Microvirgula aerodenitrificans TaxID=57480 RepID=A0A2S0PBT0_9NEIS|nr:MULTISPECIES: type I-E CRISPR-associated endonuclease Cas1e [Microvirgula]AVY94773.1 type I-E CRISPR-associated endonuclease Cas1 [Microvirgula aerodenitrificans]RAS17143.1 CRISPR-associated Cas1 family protein [Microvirgula sp. AG722]
MSQPLPKLKPIPVRERLSVLFVERCQLDVLDGAFVAVDTTGIRTHIPIGGVACLLLEPGVRVSHAACKLAAEVGTLLVWVGEAGVRLYSAGQPGGARADRLLHQARLALDDDARLKVVREMYRRRFGDEPPQRRSVEQLRGIEGTRVRALYKLLAGQYGVKWQGRNYDRNDWDAADPVNRCLSAANHCLYGVVEAAVLAAGYAPAIGFIHSGKPLSFVYDIADLYKFETVVPAAFAVAAKSTGGNDERTVRQSCRDMFRRTRLLERIIPDIEELLAAGGLSVPVVDGVVEVAIPEEKGLGDAGHRT